MASIAKELYGKNADRSTFTWDNAAMHMAPVSMIVAFGKNRVMGKENKLLWHIPDDLKRFKSLTLGHPVIMGRKTFESIVALLGKPLPGRINIVVTRNEGWGYPGVVVARSVEDSLIKAQALNPEQIFIGGGAQIYEQALPHTNKLYLTIIDDEKAGDVYFPEYEKAFTKKSFEETHEHQGISYRWIDLEK